MSLQYAQERKAYESEMSDLRKAYRQEYLDKVAAEEARRASEAEEIRRLKLIRLEEKRKRAIEGVKWDELFKKEMRDKKDERIKRTR